jgi:hypothetical protein
MRAKEALFDYGRFFKHALLFKVRPPYIKEDNGDS